MILKIDIQKGFDLTKPLPYAIVTLLDEAGEANAIGVSWVTRTSIEPPMVLISVGHGRYSHNGLMQHPEFVVNYPDAAQKGPAWFCGRNSGRDMDKIAQAGFEVAESRHVQVPTLKEVRVALECKTVSHFTTGDHTVFVGEVLGASSTAGTKGCLYDTVGPLKAYSQDGKTADL